MEARFIVKRQSRKEDSIAFARLLYVKQRIVYAILALVYWGYIVYSVQYGWWWFMTVLIAFAVLLTALVFFHPRYMGWRIYRAANKKIKESTTSFGDENLQVVTNLDSGTISYDAFIRIAENKGYYYLFVQKYTAFILPKCDFTLGKPEEFGAFIEEKTGLEIQRVRG